MFNEHTWGAHNSISNPDHLFAKSQWIWKRERALEAGRGVRALLGDAVGGTVETTRFYMDELSGKKSDDRVIVYNTHSWAVSQVVELNSAFGQVFDAEDQPVDSSGLPMAGWHFTHKICRRSAAGNTALQMASQLPSKTVAGWTDCN